MNILFVTHCTEMLGANSSMVDLIEGLCKKNCRVVVAGPVCHNGQIKESLKQIGVKYRGLVLFQKSHVKISEANNIRTIKTLIKELLNIPSIVLIVLYSLKYKIDIIHTNSFVTNVGAIAAKLSGKPHIWHIREFMEEHYGYICVPSILQRMAINTTNKFIAISNALMQKYVTTVPDSKITVIYDGIREFVLPQYTKNIKRNLNSKKFIMVGQMDVSKGTLDVIAAFSAAIGKGLKNSELWLVGPYEQDFKLRCDKIIKENKIEKLVKWFGFQENVIPYLQESDIGLMCSNMEALGRVTIEYMRTQNLVIGSNSGATPELLEYGELGLVFEQGDVMQLADKILEAAIMDDSIKADILLKAKKKADKEFSLTAYTDKIMELYKTILL